MADFNNRTGSGAMTRALLTSLSFGLSLYLRSDSKRRDVMGPRSAPVNLK